METNHKVRVLIAEDDYLVAEMIIRALKSIGHEFIGKARNGMEAIAMTNSLRPDVILMDIQMPKLDGLEAARQIQDQVPTPIVILTAHESQTIVNEASEAGVAGYLTKPPNAAEIERAITIALARFEDMRKLRHMNKELQQAFEEIKILKGILPICSHCNEIRDKKGNWVRIERYIEERSEAQFSHSICETCLEKYYPEED